MTDRAFSLAGCGSYHGYDDFLFGFTCEVFVGQCKL